MNLLSILLSVLTSGNALTALSKKTGISKSMLKKLIPLAVPLLLRYMTGNAASQAGASSLLGALTQHTSKKPVSLQIEEADETDGGKIVGHILGDSRDSETGSLASGAGLSRGDVNKVLSVLAPALLCSLSAAKSKADGVDLSDGLDLSDVAAMLGAKKKNGLFSSLFSPQVSVKEEEDLSANGMNLLTSLLSAGLK
ncbi:MAG: DUF937 domain-containing protein [Oscillospiraceae bacterium]|jgi:hypothetical protein|nr:DUF937 domain-containing protein [Oscillospiraceae bacterium]